jgi:excisionase family DNA binding protein
MKYAYRVEEAAELLSLSRAHVYRLLEVGLLGSITIGRSRRITAGQLTQFIQKLETQQARPFRD